VTIGVTLLTDLLSGVLLGLTCAILLVAWRNADHAVTVVDDGEDRLVRLSHYISFLHKARLQRALRGQPRQRHLVVDGTRVWRLDPEIVELLRELEQGRQNFPFELSIKRSEAAQHEFFRPEVRA
jgi:MFS superfamily sulfate permease-like transporter